MILIKKIVYHNDNESYLKNKKYFVCMLFLHLTFVERCKLFNGRRRLVTDVEVIKLLREALMTIMIISAPILGVGMIVGLIIAIFQTTTSIQEQTLTFVPKIVAIFFMVIVLAAWIIHTLVNYTKNTFMIIEKIGTG